MYCVIKPRIPLTCTINYRNTIRGAASSYKMALPLGWVALTLLLSPALASGECVGERPTKQLICRHTESEPLHEKFDPCLCTHLVLHTTLDKLDQGIVEKGLAYRKVNPRLRVLANVREDGNALRKEEELKVQASKLQAAGLQGVFIDINWTEDVTPAKSKLLQLVKTLATELDNIRSSKRASNKYERTESAESDESESTGVLLRLPNLPQHLGRNYDLKKLSKYVDYFVIATENITDSTENGLTYHHSRLMGIDDILNADSLVDLVTGLGAPHDKLVLTLPAAAFQFRLADPEKNMARSPASSLPHPISQAELCSIMDEGGWTVERDEDLTAPYAFRGKTWVAFDDITSAAIKGKYILLRDLGGAALDSIQMEDWAGKCNKSSAWLLSTLHDTFTNIARKPRAAQLIALQEQIHHASQLPFSADVQLSPYRIVRVVDRAGAIHVVRKDARTAFTCSRQGYFTHPSGCNRFYRCVKFNQHSPQFTVFEYDCPAGLAFDERYEVCVWPGSLPHSAACHGSSEIAPVPRNRFSCPQVQGYYADPENCRWFFACLDHRGDGSPLTAYEFRCPFGLVFNEKKLVCDWPWHVEGCGSGIASVHGVVAGGLTAGDILEGRLRPSYAHISDVHVSGGRIENVNGGLVLGSSLLSGVQGGAELRGGGDGYLDLGAYEGLGSRGGLGHSAGLGVGIATGGHASQYSGGSSGQYVQDNSGEYVHDNSGDYIHDSRGDHGTSGGAYVAGTLESGSGGAGAAISGSGAHVGVIGLNSGGYVQDNSGGYVHDGRGDYASSGGAYSAEAGAALGSGAYVHDSRGDHGGSYEAGKISSGVGLGSYVSGGEASLLSTGGSASTLHGGAVLASVGQADFHGKQTDSGAYVRGNEGQYIHDGRGDYGTTGGAYIAGKYGAGGSSAESGAYIHDGRGDHGAGYVAGQYSAGFGSRPIAGGNRDFVESYRTGAGAAFGSGAYVHDNRGDYVHDTRGDYGGGYVAGQYASGSGSLSLAAGSGGSLYGKLSGLGTYAAGQGGLYIHDNSGQYIHDNRGDHGGAYVAGSGIYSSGGQANTLFSTGGSSGFGKVIHASTPRPLTYYQPVPSVTPASVAYGSFDAAKINAELAHSGVSVTPAATVFKTLDSGSLHVTTPAPSTVLHAFEASKVNTAHIGVPVSGIKSSGTVSGLSSGSIFDSSRVNLHTAQPALSVTPAPNVYHGIDNAHLHVSQPELHIATGDNLAVTPGPAVYKTPLSVSSVTPATGVLHQFESSKLHLSQPAISLASGPSISTVAPATVVQETYVSPNVGQASFVTQSPVATVSNVHGVSHSSVPLNRVQFTYGNVAKPTILQPLDTGKVPVSGAAHANSFNSLLHDINVGAQATLSQGYDISGYNYQRPSIKFETPLRAGYQQNLGLIDYGQIRPVLPTVQPISVSSTPIIPLKPVQYIQKHVQPVVSTVAPPVASYSFQNSVVPIQTKVQPTVQPITVTSSPVIPLKPVQYIQDHVQPIIGVQRPVLSSYAQQKPIIPADTLSVSQVHSYGLKTPAVSPFSFVNSHSVPLNTFHNAEAHGHTVVSTTASPQIAGYSYQQPIAPLNQFSFSSPAPVSFNYAHKSASVLPISVSTTPVVPLKHIQYAQKHVQPIVSTTVAPPLVSHHASVSPIDHISFTTSTPHHVSYGLNTAFVPPVSVTSAPVIPLKPVQYHQKHIQPIVSTTAVPHVDYSFQKHAIPVQPISVSSTPIIPLKPVQYIQKHVQPIVTPTVAPHFINSYSYQQPVALEHQISVSTPAPAVASYGFRTPTVQPISVTSSPAIPLKPVQYLHKHVQPIVSTTVATPVESYSYHKAHVSPVVVSSTPAVPLQPVQYIQKHVQPVVVSSTPAPFTNVVNNIPSKLAFSYSYERPLPNVPSSQTVISYPESHVVGYKYSQSDRVQPLHPVQPLSSGFGDYGVRQSAIPVRPFVATSQGHSFVGATYNQPQSIASFSNGFYKASGVPVKTYRYSTPAPSFIDVAYKKAPLPVTPISFTTPAPAFVDYSYRKTAVPVHPVAVTTSTPTIVGYSYQKPIAHVQPLAVSTPAPAVVDYSFQKTAVPFQPLAVTTPAPAIVGYSYQKPVVPVRPSFISTPAPAVVDYSYRKTAVPIQPLAVTTSAPAIVGYSYQKPAVPLRSYTVSTPAPAVSVQPLGFSTPAPAIVGYSYQKPVVPLRPLPVSTPAPAVLDYSYQKTAIPVQPLAVSTPAPAIVGYSYQKPLAPVQSLHTFSHSYKQPIVSHETFTYTTPAPSFIDVTHKITPAPVAVSSVTPAIVDYSYKQTAGPLKPLAVTTPSPAIVGYSYQSPVVPVRPLAFSTSAPAVDYGYRKTVVTSTPAPAIVGYSYKKPVVHEETLTLSTPAPAIVGYSYQKPVSSFVVGPSAPAVVSHSYAKPVISTATPIINYSYKSPAIKTQHVAVTSTTPLPTVVSSTPDVPLNPVQYVNKVSYEEPLYNVYQNQFATVTSTPKPIVDFSYERQPEHVVLDDALKYQAVKETLALGKGNFNSYGSHVSAYVPEVATVTTARPELNVRVPVQSNTIFEEYFNANRNQGVIGSGQFSGASLNSYNQLGLSVNNQDIVEHSTATPVVTVDDSAFGVKTGGEFYQSTVTPIRKVVYKKPVQTYVSTDAAVEGAGLNVGLPFVTSTTTQPGVLISTVQPFVKRVRVQGPGGSYLVRKQKVRVRPLVTENYPQSFYSTPTLRPLVHSTTLDLSSPTFYTTTVRPIVTSTSTLPPEELEIADDYEENSAKLLEQYSGGFGDIINTGEQGIVQHGGASSTTVTSLKDGEAIVGVVKKEKYNGNRAKVVVVSRLSDFNPILVGKLGAECSCKSRSNTLNLRGRNGGSGQSVSRTYLPAVQTSTFAPLDAASAEEGGAVPFLEIKPTVHSEIVSTTVLADPVDGIADSLEVSGAIPVGGRSVGVGGAANVVDTSAGLKAGLAFDRYGPGGLRGLAETLQGSVDCQRAGLFRHPKFCNKFYSCNWDAWKKRFTLHVFNCPIHLAYDSNLGACNWPSKGPACVDDNLLV